MSTTLSPSAAPKRVADATPGDADITRRLLDAAVTVFGKRGYEAATVAEIANIAEVTTGALFRRWRTKHLMFAAVVEHVCESNPLQSAEAAEMSPVEKFYWLASNLLSPERSGMRSVRAEACLSAARDPEIRASVAHSLARERDELAALLAEGEAAGEIDLAFDTDVYTFHCHALTIGTHILRRALEGEEYVPSDQEWRTFAAQMFEYLNLRSPGTPAGVDSGITSPLPQQLGQ